MNPFSHLLSKPYHAFITAFSRFGGRRSHDHHALWSSSKEYNNERSLCLTTPWLHLNPPDAGRGALQATNRHVGGYKHGVFCQGGLHEGAATGEISVRVGPGGHPGWLLDFDSMMKEVANAIEGLSL